MDILRPIELRGKLGRQLKRIVAVLATQVVVGCGGGSSGDNEAPRVWWARVAGCGTTYIHDDGFNAYVTVPPGCWPTTPLLVEIGHGTQGAQVTLPLSIADFDAAAEVAPVPQWRRTLSVHRRGTWREIPNASSWDWRDGAGLLAKDGGLYLLGGWNSDTGRKNDVWFTRDLRDWALLTSAAPWPARHGAAWVVHRDRLYVIGGDLIDDVWSSADGMNWHEEVRTAPFGKRYTPNAVSDGERIMLYEGQYWAPYDWCAFVEGCSAVGLDDLWSSADGKAWTSSGRAPWSGRGLVHGGARFKGRIYVIGGGLKLGLPGAELAETVQEFSDVWSSADGSNWRLESNTLGFSPRTHFGLLATESACWVVSGSVGTQANTTGEVYRADDCVNFRPLEDPSPMGPRHAPSVAEFNGTIVVLGGHRDTAGTSVWQYFPRHPGD